jgi:5-methylcytosine-specific restriction endonuclease McrA
VGYDEGEMANFGHSPRVQEDRNQMTSPAEGYRERSLKIHGLICAKCGREFTGKNRRLLTVHHKDGNHLNNPADGSNWENLCVYCHDDEHSRQLLGDYLRKE